VREGCERLLRQSLGDSWIGVPWGDHNGGARVRAVQNETLTSAVKHSTPRAAKKRVISGFVDTRLESSHMMSTRMIYSSRVVWFAMVTALVGFAVFAGVHMTLATGLLRWR
jgi:hypothetical protein